MLVIVQCLEDDCRQAHVTVEVVVTQGVIPISRTIRYGLNMYDAPHIIYS